MVSDEAFRQFLFATCSSLVGSFWNSYHLGSDIFLVQFFFIFFIFRPWQKQLWLRLLAGDTKLCKLQDTASMTKYMLISLKAAVLCVYCVFFSLCPGVSIRAEEGLGHQQYKHEAVCQSDAHADGRQTQIQAPVEEGGVSHTAVLPLLHLPPWRKGHVSLLLSPVVPSQCLQKYDGK